MREAALAYAARGWPVFPTVPRAKRPHPDLAPRGLKNATIATDRIAAWWRACPAAGVAIRCGDPLLVVDVDGPDAASRFEELQRRHGPLPQTAWVATPRGGWHAYFTQDGTHGNTAGKLAEGIDTRGAGGYVLAPPSIHPNGRAYEWHGAVREPAPAPAWLLRLLRPPRVEPPGVMYTVVGCDRYATAALRSELDAVARAPQGTRNHTLNAAAFSLGQLVGAGMLEGAEVHAALIEASAACGLPEREARRTIASGLSAGIAQPRAVAS